MRDLWFTENGCTATFHIAKMTISGTGTEYGTASSQSAITAGPDGALWFGNNATVGRIPTSAGSDISTYGSITAGGVNGITTGPDGALWFTEGGVVGGKNYIGRIDPTTHVITEYSFASAGVSPYAIAAGPDGAIWFTEAFGNAIGHVAIQTSNVKPHGGARHELTSGSDK